MISKFMEQYVPPLANEPPHFLYGSPCPATMRIAQVFTSHILSTPVARRHNALKYSWYHSGNQLFLSTRGTWLASDSKNSGSSMITGLTVKATCSGETFNVNGKSAMPYTSYRFSTFTIPCPSLNIKHAEVGRGHGCCCCRLCLVGLPQRY